jgi:hypothetical protein
MSKVARTGTDVPGRILLRMKPPPDYQPRQHLKAATVQLEHRRGAACRA